jgi:transcriptional regulator with XRE-family HTH domain
MTKLTTYLSEASISQAKLSEVLGISRSHMSLLVSGERKPGLDLAVAIERATDGAVPASSWVDEVQSLPTPAPKEDAA